MRTTKLTDYVKTAEAAEILGVAQNTLRKWAARGDIPMHRNRRTVTGCSNEAIWRNP